MSEWTGTDLLLFYKALNEAHGSQNWWPSDTPFETIIGAILAQNVSWKGAHDAVRALTEANLMEPDKLHRAGPEIITPLIRSSRYYNQKTQKILLFVNFFLKKYDGSINRMAEMPTGEVRSELLALSGFGPETVDSILLYALEKPVFVVDAYTRRIGARQGWFPETSTYEQMQDFFMRRILPDVYLYNDYHAQIVYLGNHICKKNPVCVICPVKNYPGLHECEYAKMENTRV